MPELIETVACGGAAKWQDYVAAWCARKFNELSCSLVFSWMPVGSAGDGPYGACCLMFFSSIAVGGQSTCRRSTSAFVAAKVRSTRGFCCAAHAASGVPRHRSCGDADPCRAGKASCRAALASACRVSIYRSAPRELRQPAARAALFASGNRLLPPRLLSRRCFRSGLDVVGGGHGPRCAVRGAGGTAYSQLGARGF